MTGVLAEKEQKPSAIGQFITNRVIRPPFFKVLGNLNLVVLYITALLVVSGWNVSIWFLVIWPVLFVLVRWIRKSYRERERRQIAHRIPFFADALGNALSVGATLDQAFEQSSYFLKGKFMEEFKDIMAKSSYGKDLGEQLRVLDNKYPQTGLRYLISLLEQYRDLGVGISPLLKQMADALKLKEAAEERTDTILAGGSSYAKLSIGVFGMSFFVFAFLLKDQINALLTPALFPTLLSLITWSVLGMIIVNRITSVQFANYYALRPYIKSFMEKKQWTIEELLHYCGFEGDLEFWRNFLLYLPLGVGFLFAYATSWYSRQLYALEIGYLIGVMITRFCIEFSLKGVVEDQLIRAVETFPDFLQVFMIGLNSGLNTYRAFEFSEEAMVGMAPQLLRLELSRVKQALLCGEKNIKVWQRLARKLPFETITDFCELMIVSPLHGESIIKSIFQMMKGYHSKKLNLVEKKATSLGQMVIPVIVVAFFPLFLFVVFGPLWVKITSLFV